MLRSLLQKIFLRLGYRISRVSPFEQIKGPLRFGIYKVETESRELLRIYREFPEMNQAMARLLKLLGQEGSVAMIDIGANCGDTLAIAKAAFPKLEVLCIEGDDSLFQVLTGNSRQFSNVTLKKCFLGEERKEVLVSMEKQGWNNTLVDHADGAQAVQLETLDKAVAAWDGLPKLRLIKCDTEGYDVRILFGGRKTLLNLQPALFFEYNREAMDAVGETGFRIFSFLRDQGYRTILFYDNLGRLLLNTDLASENLLQDLHDYADGKTKTNYYYDVIILSERDAGMAETFIHQERLHRKSLSPVEVSQG